MSRLPLILGLLSVVALLMLGAGGAWAGPAPMPCHEAAAPMTQEHGAPETPAKAMTMACCVACVAPALAPPPPSAAAPVRRAATTAVRSVLPAGRRPSPETGPPKA